MAHLTNAYQERKLCTISPQTTLYSSVFASASRVNLAHKCGLTFDSAKLQSIAGLAADIPALRAAHELALAFADRVLDGAAAADSALKLKWLHEE
eukprot:4244-Heterococcus_DN1.PRE.1